MAYTEENNYSNNFLQHAIQLFSITFAGITVKAVRLHRLNLHLGTKKDPMQSFRQFSQDYLSGTCQTINITLVINQLNEHLSLR